MADISAIKALDGVTYSIKDSEAREHLVPTGGITGQVLTKTSSGYDWQTGGSGGGNVDTVNGISPDADKNVQVDVELTKAEYDALPSSKLTDDVNYWITDGANNPLNNNMYATGVVYDNADSGLTATNAQDAIDELSAGLILQFTSTGWTSETVNGTTYYTKSVSVSNVSGHPVIGIVPITGTLPTTAEQSAFDSVSYFTADNTANTIKAYAISTPLNDFAVIVKGAM